MAIFSSSVYQVGGLDASAEVLLLLRLDAVALELGQLLLDRGQLLAEEELALLAVHALLHVLADRLGDVELGEVLAGEADDELEPLAHVDRREHSALLVGRQVRRVTRRVGEQRQVADAGDAVDQLGRAALVEDRGDEALVLAGELERRGVVRAPRLDDRRLDHSAAPGPVVVDYLQKIAVPGDVPDEAERVTRVVEALKDHLAMETARPVVAIVASDRASAARFGRAYPTSAAARRSRTRPTRRYS